MNILKNHKFIFFLILIFAGFLRLWNLSSMPPSVNWDEISHGYNAYSILKTGSDEWGKFLPITNFRAYGDYPLPLNLYLTIPFISALGLNELAIRLPHAILGVLTVISTYFLSIAIFKEKKYALFTAFLVSVTPWYLFASRFVLQSNLAVFFLISGMAILLNKPKSKRLTTIAIAILGLTLFSYHSTRIFTPLLAIPIVFQHKNYKFSKLGLLLTVTLAAVFVFLLSNPEARARSNEVFLLNPKVIYSIEVLRNNSELPLTVKKLIYNKPVYFATHFAQNYIEYFSPKFLFLSGGTQYQFSVPDHGLLYLVELPFFYIGLLLLLHKVFVKKDGIWIIVFAWLILSPIPASITTEHFAVVRATPMLPIPEIMVTLGVFDILERLKEKYSLNKNLTLMLIVFLLSFSLIFYLNKYFNSYKKDYSWAWQYGYKDLVNFTSKNYEKYDKIIVTKKYGEPHEFFLFYNQFDPHKYKSDPNLIRFNQSNWWWVDGFDKYVFINDWEIPKKGSVFITESKHQTDCLKIRCLLATGPQEGLEGWSKVNTIYFLDGKVAFELYENN